LTAVRELTFGIGRGRTGRYDAYLVAHGLTTELLGYYTSQELHTLIEQLQDVQEQLDELNSLRVITREETTITEDASA
jgi:hypothetical protein